MAELLGRGPVGEEPALNYYHWKLGSEAAMNETLRGYLSALRAPLPGAPLVLVGHSTAFAAMGVAAPKAGGGLVQIGRAHVCTPVTNAHLVCRLLLEKKNKIPKHNITGIKT